MGVAGHPLKREEGERPARCNPMKHFQGEALLGEPPGHVAVPDG